METLPPKPNLELQRKRAKALLRAASAVRLKRCDAFGRSTRSHRRRHALTLADAQLVIARGYGFESWAGAAAQDRFADEDTAGAVPQRRCSRATWKRARAARAACGRSGIGERAARRVRRASGDDGACTTSAVIDVLLEYGADLNLKSEWWAGPFGILEYDITPEQAVPLIARGAIVDIFAAAHLDMPDRVRELVEADQSLVFARGGDGKTALHCARTVEVAVVPARSRRRDRRARRRSRVDTRAVSRA